MIPHAPSLALAVALAAAPLCAAQGGPPDDLPERAAAGGGAVRTFGDGTLPDWLRVYDVDGDGILSVEEQEVARDARRQSQTERARALTELWDADGDGSLSPAEIENARAAHRQRILSNREMRFEEADSNADDHLSAAEFRAIPAIARLESTDANRPGIIFQRLDGDADGSVSRGEFLAHLAAHPPNPDPSERVVERGP